MPLSKNIFTREESDSTIKVIMTHGVLSCEKRDSYFFNIIKLIQRTATQSRS